MDEGHSSSDEELVQMLEQSVQDVGNCHSGQGLFTWREGTSANQATLEEPTSHTFL